MNKRIHSVWIACGIFTALFIYTYSPALISILERWIRIDEAYGHGFLIFIIAIYLVYRLQDDISRIKPEPVRISLLPIAGISLLWGISYFLDIEIIQQVLMPVLILSIILFISGKSMFKLLLFPVCFIYFAIPVWDYLTGALVGLTIYINKFMLTITHITAYIQGDSVLIPSGRIVIEGGCSGLRYLIICTALTSLSSYLYLKHWKDAAILVTTGIFIGLFINWTRVFTLILIGYYSKMTSPLIKNHELYGWVLFAVFFFPVLILFRKSPSEELKESSDIAEP